MSEERVKRQYTKRSAEDRQLAAIDKVQKEIEKLQASIDAKKEILAAEMKKLEDIRSGAEKARKEAEQKEINKLIAKSGISLDDIKAFLESKTEE